MGLPSVSLGDKFIQQAPEFLGRDKVSVLDVFSRHMTSLLWGEVAVLEMREPVASPVQE